MKPRELIEETRKLAETGERVLLNANHQRHECRCASTDCAFCAGGLYACEVCNGFEGSVPTDCPGQPMSQDEQDAVYAGERDFVGGKWVDGAVSRNSPAFAR